MRSAIAKNWIELCTRMGSPKIREYRSSRKHRADEIVLNELIYI